MCVCVCVCVCACVCVEAVLVGFLAVVATDWFSDCVKIMTGAVMVVMVCLGD